MAAHLTILPPRTLRDTEASAIATLEEICSHYEPFEVSLAEVETFIPITPTVFIRVGHAAFRMRELHDRLTTGALATAEDWPYMPHLTIAKMDNEVLAQQAYYTARHRWAEFEGSRCVEVKQLSFVREERINCWVDLAGVSLGSSLVPSRNP
jgi:2'-5' RNA ligase